MILIYNSKNIIHLSLLTSNWKQLECFKKKEKGSLVKIYLYVFYISKYIKQISVQMKDLDLERLNSNYGLHYYYTGMQVFLVATIISTLLIKKGKIRK